EYLQSESNDLELLLSNNESESPYLNNETETLSSDIESDSELEEILENDNESESELPYLNNKPKLLLSDIKLNSKLEEVLENDNDFIEYFLNNS
ncbi:11257_t:CDS:1, partial [Dentiscutata heterogama]